MLRPPARAWCAQARGHLHAHPRPQPHSWVSRACSSGWAALRELASNEKSPQEEQGLSWPLSLTPPPPSMADSSCPSTGLTCFYGNENPGSGSLWSCHLLLLHLSSVKHPSLVPLGCAERIFRGWSKEKARGKEGKQEGGPGWPHRAHWTGQGRESGTEGEVGGCEPMCLPCRISTQASAGGHRHILLPSTGPLMRDVGGGGEAGRRLGREGSCAESCAGPGGREQGEG